MSTAVDTIAPISGLLSLVSDAFALAPTDTGALSDQRVAPEQVTDPAALLGQLAGGWLAMKEDGQGWMLLHFAPGAQPASRHEARTADPSPMSPELGARACRVHTALTRREREVLRLVAGGASNNAIGSRLFISPKTASVHVSNILTKLDATSRTEAAALAHASGLVRVGDMDPRPENA
jgi:DNA-binding CsgD family transcriptional regulator